MQDVRVHAFTQPTSTDPETRKVEQAYCDRTRAQDRWIREQPEFKAADEPYEQLMREESQRVRSSGPPPDDPEAFSARIERFNAHREKLLVADVGRSRVYTTLAECWEYAHSAVQMRGVARVWAASRTEGPVYVDLSDVGLEARRLYDSMFGHDRMVRPPGGFADQAEWFGAPPTLPSAAERERRTHERWLEVEREYHAAWKSHERAELELRDEEFASLGEHPAPDDLVYAATQVCSCGAGLAHPKGVGSRGAWWCSAVLLRKASRSDDHAGPVCFAQCDMTREGDDPQGRTTRPA
jgi:hypothetical protein